MRPMQFSTGLSVQETDKRTRNYPAGWKGEVDDTTAIEARHFKAAEFTGPDADAHEKWVRPHVEKFSRAKQAEERAKAEAARKAAIAAVDIPEGWKDMKAEEMIDLAARLGAGPEVKTKEQAVEHIEKIVLERSNGGDHKLF